MLLRKGVCLPALAAVLAASTAAPARAGNGLYVGGTAGSSLFHDDKSDFDNAVNDAFNQNGLIVTGSTSTLDQSSFAYSGIIGYQFMREIAVEASYTDLGKLRYHSTNVVASGFTQLNATADLDGKAKGPTVAVLGFLPLSPQWEVFARAGIFISKVTLDASVAAANQGMSGASTASQSANSASPLIGVGLAWNPSKQFKIRAEYTRFFNVGDKDTTGQINIDMFDVGLTYSFQ